MKAIGSKKLVDIAKRMCFRLVIDNMAFNEMINLKTLKFFNVIPTHEGNGQLAFPHNFFEHSIRNTL